MRILLIAILSVSVYGGLCYQACRPDTLPIDALIFPRLWNPCTNVIGLVIITEVLRSLLMIADCPTNHAQHCILVSSATSKC